MVSNRARSFERIAVDGRRNILKSRRLSPSGDHSADTNRIHLPRLQFLGGRGHYCVYRKFILVVSGASAPTPSSGLRIVVDRAPHGPDRLLASAA